MILELGDVQSLQTNPAFTDYVEGTIRLAPYCSKEMKELVETVLVPTWYQSIGNSEEPPVRSQCDTSQVNTQATTTGWYVTPHDKKSPASEEPPAPLPTIETSPLSSVPAGTGWDDNTSAANGITAVEETIAAWTPQDQNEPIRSAGTAAAHDKGVDTQHVSAAEAQASSPAPIRRSSSRKRSKGNAHASTSVHKSTTRGPNDELQVPGDNHTVTSHASSSGTSAATLDESEIPSSAWGLHSQPHLRLLAAARYLDTFPRQSLVLQDEPMVAHAAHAEALEVLYRGGQDNITAAEQFFKALHKQEEWERENGYAGR